jgi:hypothetical protein
MFSIRRTVTTGKGKKRKVKHLTTRYTYGAQVLATTKAATGKIAIAPTTAAAGALVHAGSVKVTINVTFKPSHGTARTESAAVTVRRGSHGNFAA